MTSPSGQREESPSHDEEAIRALCQGLWAAWNQCNGEAFAALFENDGYVVGFDGSQVDGRAEVEEQLSGIFANHQPAAYVGKVRGVRFLAADVAILRAIVGMVPPGMSDLNPAVNAMQTLVATKRGGGWRIASFQNTPAQFHGRPELVQQMTEELRQLL